MQQSQRKEDQQHLRKFVDFFDIHDPFHSSSELRNIATGIIADEPVNADDAIKIGKEILNKIDGKMLGDISFKKKDQAITFGSMQKSVRVGDKDI